MLSVQYTAKARWQLVKAYSFSRGAPTQPHVSPHTSEKRRNEEKIEGVWFDELHANDM